MLVVLFPAFGIEYSLPESYCTTIRVSLSMQQNSNCQQNPRLREAENAIKYY